VIHSIFKNLLLLLLMVKLASSATVGKISGQITFNGKPVPGANVALPEIKSGAACDMDGHYFIMRVPPGQYLLRVTCMGFKSIETEIVVISGQTSKLDFELDSQVLSGEEVLVIAKRNPIPVTRTSKMAVISGDRINDLPVSGYQDLLAMQSGLTTDSQGRLHVRGGRHSELKFMVDGVNVVDPNSGEFNGLVNEDAISELVVVAGTFNAEYGDAMSGVVNIVSQAGSSRPEFGLRYRSEGILRSPWRKNDPFIGVEDEEEWEDLTFGERHEKAPSELRFGIPGKLNLRLSGPLTKDLRGQIAAYTQSESSHLPHGYNSEGDLSINVGNDPMNATHFQLGIQRSFNEYQKYSHVWKYIPFNQAVNRKSLSRVSLGFNTELSAKTFLSTRVSWLENDNWYGVLDSAGNPLAREFYERPVLRDESDFYRSGHSTRRSSNTSKRKTISLDLSTQYNSYHEFKSGFEYSHTDLDKLTEYNVAGDQDRYEDEIAVRVSQLAAYVQDKFEYDMIVLNVGLRYDWRDPDAGVWPNLLLPFDLGEDPVPLEDVDPQTAVSPRFGIAFPITDRMALHVSYGHFYQFAPLYALYLNLDRNLSHSRVPTFGNPGVKPQQTVAFEIGISSEFAEFGLLSITAWSKDLTDLLSTVEIIQFTQQMVAYSNSDYANVLGIDFSLFHPMWSFGDFSIDYTWMQVRGNAAEPESGKIRIDGGQEIQFNEFPLDYDQRHDITAALSFKLPQRVQLELIAQAASGLPYTPFIDIGITAPTNSATKPWTLGVDASLRWREAFNLKVLDLWVEVQNLFDRQNVIDVYASTGDPFEDPLGLIGSTPDALHNPANVDAPRQMRIGLQINY
jgi:outer membrane receptor protein involved in Fe transport